MAKLTGGGKLAGVLKKIAKSSPTVEVGFLSGATYPDGTSVAVVAAANEFGVPSRGQPPRPFFRNMIADKQASWPKAIEENYKRTGDLHTTFDRMGQGIKGQLQDSIRQLTDPPLAASTVRRKGHDKPLIDTGHMLNSVDYRVKD